MHWRASNLQQREDTGSLIEQAGTGAWDQSTADAQHDRNRGEMSPGQREEAGTPATRQWRSTCNSKVPTRHVSSLAATVGGATAVAVV